VGKLDSKVALITGAARGQGRAHAVRMAQEGADVLLVDACTSVTEIDYPAATAADLAETVRQVEALDRRAVWAHGDVRDLPALQELVDRGRPSWAGSTSSWPTPASPRGAGSGR
jgi:NAD(P)-dependent dehydrogenase (short-subunit alcohol dehydrogenase family)